MAWKRSRAVRHGKCARGEVGRLAFLSSGRGCVPVLDYEPEIAGRRGTLTIKKLFRQSGVSVRSSSATRRGPVRKEGVLFEAVKGGRCWMKGNALNDAEKCFRLLAMWGTECSMGAKPCALQSRASVGKDCIV